MLDHISVSSSNLKSVGYDKNTNMLEIAFHDNSLYEYENVPSEMYHDLMSAASHGVYFHQNIKNRFVYHQVK